ncbi:sigma factor-like helix-turn-helix DNA-binding protein [Desulfitobacterium sp.]|uniref:sigma factor-like helix-turn-helix DNA-binding protein n=1 Tax=Desulfitobacterium sp. TaxID=49981 RepID=UPI002CF3A311|nr:sigma factor-like helix-turn-helix DNA-binding protein [Desulfitobacterium sp.]HVJ50103.1 sigma factor-like helix-turn-helix DNA-binding protein [Desulfitobacterium sp.]
MTVIHNASIRAKQRNRRFNRDVLTGDSFEFLPRFGVLYSFDDLELAELINSLPKIESNILYYTFILDLTQQEIACRFNISQQQVSRIKRRALNLLYKEVI